MFLGLRTALYRVNDLAAARDWYAKVLGFGPYFDEPFYVGFNVGGYELGLDPAESGATRGNSEVVYWGVAELDPALARVLQLGAEANEPAREVGGGIRVATVTDPFGNLLGLIENPHFKLP